VGDRCDRNAGRKASATRLRGGGAAVIGSKNGRG
jgi:hypothetical protein